MDKLVQRTIKAERQVRRRLADSSKNAYRKDLLAHRRRTKSATEDLNVNIANARRVRHERWELGPLAPKRSIENGYGVATENARTGNGADQNVIRPFEREARCEWAGGSKYLNLAPGDRVVIMEGHDKGNIDTITAINVSTGTLQLKDFAKIASKTPDWLAGKTLSNDQTYPELITAPVAVPISAVRLVHPVTDPATGLTRDVIVRQLRHANVRRDRLTQSKEWDRYIPGLNTIIPWPEKTDPEEKPTKADTAREDVQEATFVPTLLRAPMPEELIHELRNRYSRFRTRHEAWYIEKKEAEVEAARMEKEAANTMLTPQEEFNRQRREERRAIGQPELTEAMLEKIGEHMQRTREARSA